MERKPLFDKPMSELREAFVRARFAQANVFGAPNIESTTIWVSAPAFGSWLREHWDGADPENGHAATLLRIATPTPRDAVVASLPDMPSNETAGAFLGTLSDRAVIYYTPEVRTVVTVHDGVVLATKLEKDGKMLSVRPASSFDVLWAISEEWECRGPKAAMALDWLNTQYAAAIRFEREKTERDFDEAVAVSADGTKIVKAKWVIVAHPVAETDRKAMIYPASAFRDNKILRAENRKDGDRGPGFVSDRINDDHDLNRFNFHWMMNSPHKSNWFLNDLRCHFTRARFSRGNHHTQWFASVSETLFPGVHSVFVITPDDLPPGFDQPGRELR